MTDFLVWLIISSFWIWGVHFCCRENQVLEILGNVIDNILPKWASKPLVRCPMCMASVHGTAIYLLSPLPYFWYMHILFVVALCGLNDIIDGLTADYD